MVKLERAILALIKLDPNFYYKSKKRKVNGPRRDLRERTREETCLLERAKTSEEEMIAERIVQAMGRSADAVC